MLLSLLKTQVPTLLGRDDVETLRSGTLREQEAPSPIKYGSGGMRQH